MVPVDAKKEDFVKAFEQAKKDGKNVRVIYAESPSNPTIKLADLDMLKELKEEYSTKENPIITAIDNTFLGPVFSTPKDFGIDVVVYSGTKFLSGSSDIVCGMVSSSKEIINKVKKMRGAIGTNFDPFNSWLLSRSMETLKIRMEASCLSAIKIANFLNDHPKVENV